MYVSQSFLVLSNKLLLQWSYAMPLQWHRTNYRNTNMSKFMKLNLQQMKRHHRVSWDTNQGNRPPLITLLSHFFNLVQWQEKIVSDLYRHCTTTIALWRFLLERLMTAQAFENVNIYILFFKTRYLKPAATRHQLRGSIVYCEFLCFKKVFNDQLQTIG